MPTFADACEAIFLDPDGEHSLYTTLAPLYERMAVGDDDHYDGQLRVVREAVPSSARTILEVGCGVGRLLPRLAERHGSATGLDVSPELLSLAADRVAARDGIDLLEVDVADPDLELEGSYDAAVSFDYLTGFLHGSSLVGAFGTLRESLHDGGTFVCDAVADERVFAEDSPAIYRTKRYSLERTVDVEDATDGSGDLLVAADYRASNRANGDVATASERQRIRTLDAVSFRTALRDAGFRRVTVTADETEPGALVATARV